MTHEPSISVDVHSFVASPPEDRCAFVYPGLNQRCNAPESGHKMIQRAHEILDKARVDREAFALKRFADAHMMGTAPLARRLFDYCTGIAHYTACPDNPPVWYGCALHWHVWFGDSPALIGASSTPCPNWKGDYAAHTTRCIP